MSGQIDLHTHSFESDGSQPPRELVAEAKAAGLRAVALTDHDTALGLTEALEAGREFGIEVVPGIELSVEYRGHGIHILGYFLEGNTEKMQPLSDWIISEREERNRHIVSLMQRDGLPVDLEEMHAHFPGSIVGRPHFARRLMELGLARSVDEAFKLYLDPGKKYYKTRTYIPMDLAFETLNTCRAKAVFAHPLQYRFSNARLRELTELLVSHGLAGVECIYTGYSEEDIAYLKALAAEYGLTVTGGSDYHGSIKPEIKLGALDVGYEMLERLKNT